MNSYAQQLSRVDQQSVYGIRMLIGSSYYYYVLAIHRNKESMFKRLLASPLKNVDFTNFGKILLSGKGERPDERGVQMLKQQYAIDIQFK